MIFTAFDSHYVEPARVMLRSLRRSNPGAPVTILAVGLSDAEKQDLASCSPEVAFIDAEPPIGVATSLYFTPTVYVRLFGPQLIQQDRLLYLDPDTLIVDDLTPLFDLTFSEPLAATQCITTPTFASPLGVSDRSELGLDDHTPYFAAGVMLIDRNKWLDAKLTDCALEYARSGRSVALADQESLNVAVKGRFCRLAMRWNQEVGLRELMPHHRYNIAKYFDHSECREAIERPAIVHFNGPRKPWKSTRQDPWADTWRQIACAP